MFEGEDFSLGVIYSVMCVSLGEDFFAKWSSFEWSHTMGTESQFLNWEFERKKTLKTGSNRVFLKEHTILSEPS